MSDKKRLLVLASTYPRWHDDVEPGFVHELSRRLSASFEVTALCPHAKDAETSEVLDGVAILRYKYAPEAFETLVSNGGINGNLKRSKWKLLLVPFFLTAQLWATVATIYRLKPDVIHAHWIIPQGLILCLARLITPNIPFILTSHGADLFTHRAKLMSWLKSWVLKQAAFVTVVSEPMCQQALQLGAAANRVAVMPMGVDFDKFTPSDDIARNPNEILFVGRLVEKKGLSYLIRALAHVRREVADVRLTVIGFGPEQASLQQLVRELELDNYVDFLGSKSQSELLDYYRRAALFVAPFIEAADGDQEGLGLVTIEAIASGCNALIGNVSAVSDLPIAKVDPKQSDAFSRTIISMLQQPNNEGSRSLRNVLREKFSWDQVSINYREVLKNVESKQ